MNYILKLAVKMVKESMSRKIIVIIILLLVSIIIGNIFDVNDAEMLHKNVHQSTSNMIIIEN